MDYKYSINAIRGLAMLGVFFFHMGLLPGAGYLPTLFIVMSGFFSVYGYDRYRNNFKGGVRVNKVKEVLSYASYMFLWGYLYCNFITW